MAAPSAGCGYEAKYRMPRPGLELIPAGYDVV
jgi:hypothetical protein